MRQLAEGKSLNLIQREEESSASIFLATPDAALKTIMGYGDPDPDGAYDVKGNKELVHQDLLTVKTENEILFP